MALVPALKRRLHAALPADLGDELRHVTPHQLEALQLLSQGRCEAGTSRPGASMNALARQQQCALSTATALVDRLIRQGLAERAADSNDRRVVRIAPTPHGEELVRRFAESRRSIGLQALSVLSDSEVETLLTLLRKIANDLPAGEEVTRG